LVSVDGAATNRVTAQAHVFARVLAGIALIIAVQHAVLFRLFRHLNEHSQAQQQVQLYMAFLVSPAAAA
jgi:HAMP domain-containing protein